LLTPLRRLFDAAKGSGMASYDFFLAYAGPDAAQAERLYDLLTAESSVFLDTRSLLPGDDWDRELAEAQRNSRVTVVLVTASTDAAFYQREEIATAIDMARADGRKHRVVPVYLDIDPTAADALYGLHLKVGFRVSGDITLEQVAARLLILHRELAGLQGAGEPSADVETQEVVYVARLGRIAAGIPNLAEHSIEGYLPLPRELVGNGDDYYVLEVSGDSMIGAGIANGDQVVVHAQPQADNGEIVVALIDGEEATVKTFKLIDGQAWLIPHNPVYTSTPFDQRTAIIGKVVTVLRKV
jgi:SOS regulatory protein LexA